MKTLIIPALIPALALTVVQSTALAAPGTAGGPSALALAAVIAQHSPAVRAFDKRVIARLAATPDSASPPTRKFPSMRTP